MLPILEKMHEGLRRHSAALEQASANAIDNKVPFHAAMVNDFSQAIHANRLVAVGRDLSDQISAATKALEGAASGLTREIASFTAETKRSSAEMSRWTFWMMVSSIVLAVFTLVQVSIALYVLFHPDPPQILFMPR